MIHVRVILNGYRMDDPVACGHGWVVFCAHVEGVNRFVYMCVAVFMLGASQFDCGHVLTTIDYIVNTWPRT